MYIWRINKTTHTLPNWFAEGEEADLTWSHIQELYDLGINVYLQHILLGEVPVMRVNVSSVGFGQYG